MKSLRVVAAALLLSSAACYQATIETGLQPSPTQIKKPWASSFVYGLVPPPTLEASQVQQKCPNGVASVETQHSFLNGLVAGLTWGIYTPMSITVTCAQSR